MKMIKFMFLMIALMAALFGCSGGGGDGGDDTGNDNDRDGYPKPIDCNDSNPFIYPGAKEICGDFIDQDCDGRDLSCDPRENDDDRDGYSENQGDCNDSNPNIHPRAFDVCGDLIDQDCSGADAVCPPVTTTTTTLAAATTTLPSSITTTIPAPITTTIPAPVTTVVSTTTTTTIPSQPNVTTIPAPTTTTIQPPATTTTIQPPATTTTIQPPATTTTIQPPATTTTIQPPATTTTTPLTTTTTTPPVTTTSPATTTTNPITTTTTVLPTTTTTTTTTTSTTTSTTTPISDSISMFAQDYQNSLNRGDLTLLMSRVSRAYLYNGQDANCFRETWQWRFAYYTYQNTRYSINNFIINGVRATVNATLSYSVNGVQTTLVVNDDLIMEDQNWKLYGNQNSYLPPTTIDMYSVDKSSGNPSSMFSTSSMILDVAIKITIENAKTNSKLEVKFFQPDGSQFGQSQSFNIILGDYPSCSRFIFSWLPEPSVSIPNFTQYHGLWRVELLVDGIHISEIQFIFLSNNT